MSNLDYFLKYYLRERPLFLSLIRSREAQLYQKFLPFKKPVLDVGVGDGFFASMAFARQLIPLRVQPLKVMVDTGVDLKKSRIEEARKLNIYKQLVTYDGKHLPFSNKSFNTVVSNCVLEHIPDLDLTLKEIFRVLKPGGVFLTTAATNKWEEYFFGNLFLGDLYKKWMRKKQVHLNLLTENGWDSAFRNAGFQIVKTDGYLSLRACRMIDICHYLSIPDLLTYKLFGFWVLFPGLARIYPVRRFSRILMEKTSPEQSGAIFYVLRKKG